MSETRRNIYVEPPVYDAFLMALKLGILKGSNASDRIKKLIRQDTRKVIAALRKAGVDIPPELLTKK